MDIIFMVIVFLISCITTGLIGIVIGMGIGMGIDFFYKRTFLLKILARERNLSYKYMKEISYAVTTDKLESMVNNIQRKENKKFEEILKY